MTLGRLILVQLLVGNSKCPLTCEGCFPSNSTILRERVGNQVPFCSFHWVVKHSILHSPPRQGSFSSIRTQIVEGDVVVVVVSIVVVFHWTLTNIFRNQKFQKNQIAISIESLSLSLFLRVKLIQQILYKQTIPNPRSHHVSSSPTPPQ
jgi:hypothetical protein